MSTTPFGLARTALLGAALLATSPVLAGPPPSAAALESRLYAPCCYGGTLYGHESEVARELRSEIETRLAQGETSEAIQSDFVARYGERVVAARSDRPMRAMSLLVTALVAMAAIGLGLVLRRWRRAYDARAVAAPRANDGARDELDERIDADLAETD